MENKGSQTYKLDKKPKTHEKWKNDICRKVKKMMVKEGEKRNNNTRLRQKISSSLSIYQNEAGKISKNRGG